jgi:hypothetical protein
MKNIVASGFFLVTLFLAVEEKVTGLKGFKTKTIKDDGAKRALYFLNSTKACTSAYRPPGNYGNYRAQNRVK